MSDEAPGAVLAGSSVGDVLKAVTEDGDEYVVHLVDAVQVNEEYRYGSGGAYVSVELDTEEHEVPTDELPTESGWLSADMSTSGRWTETVLTIWAPETEDGVIVEDKEEILGTVERLEVEERHE